MSDITALRARVTKMLNEVAEGKRGMEQDEHLTIILRELKRLEGEFEDIEFALNDIEAGLPHGVRQSSNKRHWLYVI